MGNVVARILGAAGAVLLLMTIFASGVASADPYAGKTYDEAAAKIAGWKGKPVVGSVSGGLLDTGDCIVTSSHKSIFLDPSGRNSRSSEVVLNLNCNNHVASAGHPGNSAMSPEGIAGKKDQQLAAKISNNPSWCQETDTNMTYCAAVCKRTGLCEV
jgi:hypothetical protein